MKNTKKLLSIILALGMILGAFTMLGSFSASAASAAYNGTPVTPTRISESTYAGLGLAADKWQQYNGYYAIRTAEELYGFANIVNSQDATANAVLLDDIVINSGTVTASGSSSGTTHHWVGIGNPTNSKFYYKGTFDGNGHSVSGVYMKAAEGISWSEVGFFRVLSGARIKNLTIKNSYIHAQSNIGAIAGIVTGGTSEITGCRVESDVMVVKGTEGREANVGGILGGYNKPGGYGNFPVICKINNCVFWGTVMSEAADFMGGTSSARSYIGSISGRCAEENNAHEYVTASNCFFRYGSAVDKNGNITYTNAGTTFYFSTALGGGAVRQSNRGCKTINAPTDEHTPVVSEHKPITSGDSGYRYCVVCNKRMTTLTITAPTSYAIPGASMPITARAEYSEVTSFTIAGGTNYTVNGMTVKVSADALVGSDITIKVTSAETENVHAAEGTLTLKVGVIDSTMEIEQLRNELDNAIADLSASLMAEDDDISAEIDKLKTAMTNAQNAIAALQNDSATKAELKALENALKQADGEIISAYTKAIDDAKSELNTLIEAAKEAAKTDNDNLENTLRKLINVTKTALEALIEDAKDYADTQDAALKEELTDVINSTKEALEAADNQLQDNIDAAIKKAADELEAARVDLQEKIDNNAETIATEVARLDKLIEDTEAFLLSEDARNRKELEDALAEAKETLKAAIDKVADDLEAARADLQTKIDYNTETIATEVSRLDRLVEDTKAVLEAADAKNRAELERALETAKTTLKRSIDRVSSRLTNTQNVLLNVIRAGDIQLGNRITEVNTALAEALALLETKTVEADASLKAELVAKIEAADKALDEAIKTVQKNLDDAKTELSKAIADGDAALAEKLEALEAALKAAETALKSADDTNKAELLAAIETAKADLTRLINDGDKQNADALAAAMVVLRAEMEQVRKDAEVSLTIAVVLAVVVIILAAAFVTYVLINKKKRV